MPLPVTNTAPPRELPPTGSQQAVCIGHYHVGTQETPYGDKEQIIYTFALDEARADGKPFLISTNAMTVSFDERSTLAKYIKGWLGRGVAVNESFDTSSLVDQHVMLNISHGVSAKGSPYASIDSIAKLPKGMQPMRCELSTVDYSPIDPSRTIPDDVPKWIAALIQKSREWVAYQAGGGNGGGKPAADGGGGAVGLAVHEPIRLTMAQKGTIGALGLTYPFNDDELDAALEKAKAYSDEREIAEAEATLRSLAIPY